MQTKEKIVFFILVILALFTRFFALSYPQEVVFDEVHFFNFVKNYNTRSYFFDIHPPFGKLSIAFVGWISRFDFDNNTVSNIGDFYNNNVFWLRFIPALFGALLIPLVFLFIKKLTHSIRAATLGGIFILFSNALFGQSRFILIDSQLVFFNILSLYSFLCWRKCEEKREKWIWLIITGLSSGIAISIKWIGLSSLGVIGLFLLLDWFKKKKFNLCSSVFLIILLVGAVYIFSFYAHFQVLPSSDSENISFWNRFFNLNKELYIQNASITERHPSESKWYQWIFGQKPIYYWGRESANIYLAGNPFIWIGSTLAIILSLLYLITKRKYLIPGFSFLLTAYFFNLLPFIPIKRCLFIYHYFTALVVAVIIFSILLDKYLPRYTRNKNFSFKEYFKKEYALVIIVLIVVITSVYLSSISYVRKTSPEKMENIEQILNPLKYFEK